MTSKEVWGSDHISHMELSLMREIGKVGIRSFVWRTAQSSEDAVRNSRPLRSRSHSARSSIAMDAHKRTRGNAKPGGSMCVLDGNNLGAGQLQLKVLVGSVRSSARVGGVIRANGAMPKRGACPQQLRFHPHGTSITVREAVKFVVLLLRTDQTTCPK